MTREELRLEYRRLTHCPSIKDNIDALEIYAHYILQTLKHHRSEALPTIGGKEGKILNQMILTKVLHIRQGLDGLDFRSTDGTQLAGFFDPTVIASLIRNVYETVSMFNLVYVQPKSKEQKLILYNLWVIAGLNYRQKFNSVARSPENLDRSQQEKKQIEQLKEEIGLTGLFKRLSDKDKKKINSKLEEKDYKITFEGDSVFFQSWQSLTGIMGIKQGWAEESYTYFSLYAHPSNVSVFQFGAMFQNESEDYLKMANFNISYLFMFLSIFVADYIRVYPETKETFEKQTIISQLVMSSKNVYVRGIDFSINNCLSILR